MDLNSSQTQNRHPLLTVKAQIAPAVRTGCNPLLLYLHLTYLRDTGQPFTPAGRSKRARGFT